MPAWPVAVVAIDDQDRQARHDIQDEVLPIVFRRASADEPQRHEVRAGRKRSLDFDRLADGRLDGPARLAIDFQAYARLGKFTRTQPAQSAVNCQPSDSRQRALDSI